MRALGIFFLILAVVALAWDANTVLTGYGVTGLSGIVHIWQTLDKTSYDVMEQLVLNSSGHSFWTNLALPIMSVPASMLFGALGFLLLRSQSHEIKLRAPSDHELEMVRQGMDPRRRKR